MSKQGQTVGDGATAIQSHGDTVINNGIGADEIRAIVESLSDQLPKLAAAAAAIMEVRISAFEEAVMKRFEQEAVNRDAFADPDFQHVVIDAQRAYARTGDTETHSTLIDLIAKRSVENTGSRKAFVINESISIVSQLTRSEISELAFSFLMRHTQNGRSRSLANFAIYLNRYINEFIDDLELGNSSYEYLVAQRCASISMGSLSLLEAWKILYCGLFFKGFTDAEIVDFEARGMLGVREVLVRSPLDHTKFHPNAINEDEFVTPPHQGGLSTPQLREIWADAQKTLASDAEIIELLSPSVPRLNELLDKWNDSLLKSLDLTSIGKAIGHARLSQIPEFGAPDLSGWIR